jgi:hypothetical protein
MANKGKWIAQVKGDPDSDSWEISVVRISNTHGQLSWGWFDENKLLISESSMGNWKLAPGLGERLVAIAHDYADDLNRREAGL